MKKKIHPATRRRIIREHEEQSRVTVILSGRRFVDLTLAELHVWNRMQGLPAYEIRCDEFWGTP